MWIFVIMYILHLVQQTDGTQCLRNEDIGYRSGNIYRCDDPVMSSCCEHDGEFTCCEPNKTKYLREQLKLWGFVSVLVLIIALVYIYVNKDVQVFSSSTMKKSWENITAKLNLRPTDTVSKNTDSSMRKDQVTKDL